MFSARTEKGPVTPSIVNGWLDSLALSDQHLQQLSQRPQKKIDQKDIQKVVVQQ